MCVCLKISLVLQSCNVDVVQVPSVEEAADVISGEKLYLALPIANDEKLPSTFSKFIIRINVNVFVVIHILTFVSIFHVKCFHFYTCKKN